MKSYKNKILGKTGEETAIKFLKKNKYRIIEVNYTTRSGELDIICEDKDYFVFVEVKTRKKDSLVSGVYAVNNKKQYHIFKAASTYISANNISKQPRFDIIEVEFDENSDKTYVVEHYVDAFSQGGSYAVF